MKITNTLRIALKNLLSIKMGEVKTDKAVLVWDGDEDLKAGDEVYVMDEEGNANPAEDGDYVTEDNKTIVVVEGKVAEIKDPEAEVAEEPVEETAQEEVEQEANEDVTPADEPEADPAEEETEADRIAALEARLAEFTEGLNAIINSIAALEGRIAEVEGKLAAVEAPAAEPIDENPEVKQNEHKSMLSYLRKD